MGGIVETKNASLDTLAVTIQALHVSGKQMTLAVFRQLPRRVESSNASLWGTVRYSIKDEGSLWLVFSEDGRLYRRSLIENEAESVARWVSRTQEELEESKKKNSRHSAYAEARFNEAIEYSKKYNHVDVAIQLRTF